MGSCTRPASAERYSRGGASGGCAPAREVTWDGSLAERDAPRRPLCLAWWPAPGVLAARALPGAPAVGRGGRPAGAEGEVGDAGRGRPAEEPDDRLPAE